jgi:hypothetical protein
MHTIDKTDPVYAIYPPFCISTLICLLVVEAKNYASGCGKYKHFISELLNCKEFSSSRILKNKFLRQSLHVLGLPWLTPTVNLFTGLEKRSWNVSTFALYHPTRFKELTLSQPARFYLVTQWRVVCVYTDAKE